jgi:hypothetical protein
MTLRDSRELLGTFGGCLGGLVLAYHHFPAALDGPVGRVLAVCAAISALLLVIRNMQQEEPVLKSIALLGCYGVVVIVGVTFIIGMIQNALSTPFQFAPYDC